MSKGQHALKYVYVELISTEGTKFNVVRGLFSGIKEKGVDDKTKEADKFILLYHEKDGATTTAKVQPITSLYNTKYYDIMHIEVLKNDVKEMVFLTKEDDDQEKATEMLEEILKEMVSDKRMYKDDDGIIDVATFTSMPPDKVKIGTKEKTTSSTTSTTNRSAACGYTGNGYDYNSYQKKKDPEMLMLKRGTGKKPTKDALEAMRAKLDEITEGTYDPELPELVGDVEVEEDKTPEVPVSHYMT